jgi:hypothetical protein
MSKPSDAPLLRAPTGAPIRRLSDRGLSSDGFRRFAPKLQNGFIGAELFLRRSFDIPT